MPKGPKGEKRPADVIGAAVKVMQIATGEIEEDIDGDGKDKAAVELGRKWRRGAGEEADQEAVLTRKEIQTDALPIAEDT